MEGTSASSSVTFSSVTAPTEDSIKYQVIAACLGGGGLLILVIVALILFIKPPLSTERGRLAAKDTIKKSSDLTEKQCNTAYPLLGYHTMITAHPTMIKAEDFKKEADKINGMKDKEAEAYLESIRYKKPEAPGGNVELKRVYEAEFVTSPNALHPQYEILETTQAPVVGQQLKEAEHRCLHANIFYDLYGDEFIISQAPSKHLREHHLEVVWQRNVGVIVWLGPLGTGNKKIIPYIGLSSGTQSKCGRFDTKTMTAVSYRQFYTMYDVSMRNKDIFTTVDLKGQETRQIFVVHITHWPETIEQFCRDKVTLLVEMVRSLKLQQATKGLPGIVAHCSTGFEFSTAFFAMYFNRQLQMRFNVLNVQAVLRMAERARYKSLSSKAAFDQVKVLHAVILEFIETFPVPKSLRESKKPKGALKLEEHLLTYVPRRGDAAAKTVCKIKPGTTTKFDGKTMTGGKTVVGGHKSVIGNTLKPVL